MLRIYKKVYYSLKNEKNLLFKKKFNIKQELFDIETFIDNFELVYIYLRKII